jgi:hypothetical protein
MEMNLAKRIFILFGALVKLWASPAEKDALRRTNKRVRLVRSDADDTQRLERLFLGDSVEKAIGQIPIEGDEAESTIHEPHLTEPTPEAPNTTA